MTAQRYEIREAFRYSVPDLEGNVVEGAFEPGVTGDDLTDEQAAYLAAHAVPAGLATPVGDTPPARPVVPEPDPVPSEQQEPEQ